MLKVVSHVVQEAAALPGLVMTPDRGGLCLTLGGRVTLGHLRWDGRVSVPFAPEVRDRLVAEEMASRDPDEPDAERVVFDIRTIADVARAAWLLRLAHRRAHVTAPGAPGHAAWGRFTQS